MSVLSRSIAAAVLLVLPISQAHAERLFGLTSLGTIVTFDSDAASVITSSGAVDGIGAGETLLDLDLRPSNRVLYGVSSAGVLYTIVGSSRGYAATPVGTFNVAMRGTRFGVDFNPVPDRLRVVSNFDENARVNPATGATLIDLDVNYPGAVSLDPNILGIAYRNSRDHGATTVLYGIDARTSSLVRFTAPDDGTMVTVGALGFTLAETTRVGFDISVGTGNAFMTRDDRLYALNLRTGRATRLARIGGNAGPGILGITAASVPEPASWALMIGGFGLIGTTLRQRRRLAA